MDALHLYDEPVHPTSPYMKRDFSREAKKPRSRTKRPVKYYHTDFGNARLYPPDQGPPLEYSGYGGDKSVPEFKIEGRYNPFPVDVYRAGNILRQMQMVRRRCNPPLHPILANQSSGSYTEK